MKALRIGDGALELKDIYRAVDEGCDAADRGDHATAIKLFSSAVDMGEDWVALNLGNSYRDVGKVDMAQAAFERAWRVALDPDAGFNLALLLEDMGQIAKARSVYQELIEAGYVKAMDVEAWYLHAEGDLRSAYALMEKASADPGPTGHYAAGVLGTWKWDDFKDLSAKPLLERGRDYFDDAPQALEDLICAIEGR